MFPEIRQSSRREGWTTFTLVQAPSGRKGVQTQRHDVDTLLIVGRSLPYGVRGCTESSATRTSIPELT